MNEASESINCQRVAEDLAGVLDGSAAAELLAHVAECDACRDARYDAERAELLSSEAGADFVLPQNLRERLEASPLEPVSPPPPAAVETNVTPAPRRWPSPALLAFGRRWAIPILAAAAAAAFLVGRDPGAGTSADDPELVGPPWRGKVQRLVTPNGKLEVCAPSGSACRHAREGDEIPAGSLLRTDRSTLAELSLTDGSTLSLDRLTTLRLSTRGRGGELSRGGLVADVQRQGQSGVRFEFAAGHLDVLGTKFSLRSDDELASVHVVRGQVRLSDRRGNDVVVMPGEEGRVHPGAEPVASPAASLGEALGWSEVVREEMGSESEARPRALGELKAQKPGEKQERAGAVRLASHAVRVKIAGSVARTEVEEVFSNQTDDVLEGIFRFPLPPDAKIERLALEVDGRLEEGAFVERDRAAAIWRGAIVNAAPALRPQIKDEIVWVPGPWKDPALLEWQRGGRFELRIFPIPKRGSRRIILAYSQVVKQSAAVRHYSYPLGVDPSGNSAPLDFSIDVQVRGQDPSFRVRTPGWDMSRSRESDVERLRFDAKGFVPTGDFVVDYALPDRDAEVSAWAYRDPNELGEDGAPYVALALRPKLPRAQGAQQARAVALVVDASRSVFGENYRRASALAIRLARDLDPRDRVTVLACDSTCRQLPGELRVPGNQTALDVRRFLEHETPEGASDVARAVGQGFAALRGAGRALDVVYIGDGMATAGPTRPATLERAIRASLPSGGRVISLGIGPESDADSLLALARGGAGTALPYLPGQPLSDAALTAVSALYGAALSDVSLELPAGISQVTPARLDAIASGNEVLIAGRLDRHELRGDAVLRGTVNGRPFEQRYPLELSVSASSGNAFVPRLFAASRISDLERDGSDGAKREAVTLSVKHSVASRYTSLLVLESEAMYRAFGLDNRRKAPEYSADLEADGASASGELAINEPDDTGGPQRRLAREDSARSPAGSGNGPRLLGFDGDDRGGRFEGRGSGAGPHVNPIRSPEFAPAPSPAPAAPATEAKRAAAKPKAEAPRQALAAEESVLVPQPRTTRPLVPMRRVWERRGEILSDRFVPKAASGDAVTRAELELSRDETRRTSLVKAFALASAAGDLDRASRLAERWLDKEPLDPEALTAVADVEARRGNRERAIRILGSVLDVRPGDTASHKRLARLERWAGRPELACRHHIAIAEGKSTDVTLVADAVRCARSSDLAPLADALLAAAPAENREAIERRASEPQDRDELRGDLRVEASWSGGGDVDISLLDTEGHRISWLGAATRAVISARDVTSTLGEGLAIRGATPGEYVLELTRGSGAGSAQGELVINVAGTVRRVPFNLEGDRKAVALVRISMQSRLVPL